MRSFKLVSFMIVKIPVLEYIPYNCAIKVGSESSGRKCILILLEMPIFPSTCILEQVGCICVVHRDRWK